MQTLIHQAILHKQQHKDETVRKTNKTRRIHQNSTSWLLRVLQWWRTNSLQIVEFLHCLLQLPQQPTYQYSAPYREERSQWSCNSYSTVETCLPGRIRMWRWHLRSFELCFLLERVLCSSPPAAHPRYITLWGFILGNEGTILCVVMTRIISPLLYSNIITLPWLSSPRQSSYSSWTLSLHHSSFPWTERFAIHSDTAPSLHSSVRSFIYATKSNM